MCHTEETFLSLKALSAIGTLISSFAEETISQHNVAHRNGSSCHHKDHRRNTGPTSVRLIKERGERLRAASSFVREGHNCSSEYNLHHLCTFCVTLAFYSMFSVSV